MSRSRKLLAGRWLEMDLWPVKLHATRIGDLFHLQSHDDSFRDANDSAAAGVSEGIGKAEFGIAFFRDPSNTLCFRSCAVPIFIGGAEPDGKGLAALLEAHLKDRFAVQKLLVRVLSADIRRIRHDRTRAQPERHKSKPERAS